MQAASCKLQAASCKLQAAGCRLQAARCKLQSAGRNVHAASCKLQAGGCRRRAAGCKLQAANCQLQAASCKLQTASCKLQAAGCRLQVVASRPSRREATSLCNRPTKHEIYPDLNMGVNFLTQNRSQDYYLECFYIKIRTRSVCQPNMVQRTLLWHWICLKYKCQLRCMVLSRDVWCRVISLQSDFDL